jgi:hypothetical protein
VVARGRRSGGRRAGARCATAVGGVLAAVALLVGGVAGTGAAEPLVPPPVAGDAAGTVLGGVSGDDDAGGFLRDQGVPVPEVPPCLPPTRACVDLSTGHAWLLDGGRIARGPVSITAGDRDNPTPRGQFTVQWKAQTYTSREYLVQMPWSVFFAPGGIAFHEGNPATFSAGCVKLAADDARAFFGFLQVGDRVQVV